MQKMPLFVANHMKPDPEEADPAEVMQFWQAIGVTAEILEDVCRMNPQWKDNELLVSPDVATGADCIGRVTNVLKGILKIRKFAETRWLTVGEACRGLCRGLSVGLDKVMQMVLDGPDMSNQWTHGFTSLNREMRKYCFGWHNGLPG